MGANVIFGTPPEAADGCDEVWRSCRFATCSVLPVRMACNLSCPFCFSHSSVSALRADTIDWRDVDIDDYYQFSVLNGANRLVITGGGEPLLDPDAVRFLVERGRRYFSEITCFTNGSLLTAGLAADLRAAGLSYLCYSRHADDDEACRRLMGSQAPSLERFFAAAEGLKVRCICVMARSYIDSSEAVWRYIHKLASYGVREFTFKHMYMSYPASLFRNSTQNSWASSHRADFDPFGDSGNVVMRLPWGPVVREIDDKQVCYYYEPTPEWEKEYQLCRSINLLSNGHVYASLEDTRSLLFRLPPS